MNYFRMCLNILALTALVLLSANAALGAAATAGPLNEATIIQDPGIITNPPLPADVEKRLVRPITTGGTQVQLPPRVLTAANSEKSKKKGGSGKRWKRWKKKGRIKCQDTPPVDIDYLSGFKEIELQGIRNLISFEQLQDAIKDGGKEGLVLDLRDVRTLLNGQRINPKQIYGNVSVGPYPFESAETDYNYKRFRIHELVTKGQGTIGTTKLLPPVDPLKEPVNSEGWVNQGTVAVRVSLYVKNAGEKGRDLFLGTYDTYTAFRLEGDTTRKLASFVEPPSVNLINSDDPTRMVIAFETAEAQAAWVAVEGVGTFPSDPATNHEVEITGLSPDTEYTYTVTIGEGDRQVDFFPESNFTTAPVAGQLPEDGFRFMFISDSRDSSGGGFPPTQEGGVTVEQFMGVNAAVLERAVNLGWQKGADLLLFGGDLINGYTTSVEDYAMQLEAFKQVTAGFSASNPVYTGMGNHEGLYRSYDDGTSVTSGGLTRRGILVDRFDEKCSYDTESAEAIFAAEFVNPTNAPEPEVSTRPSYEENVYSFQHGPVKFISFNNNYWNTLPTRKNGIIVTGIDDVGGAPEGYIFQDQLNWIEEELEAAEKDDSVKYVVLFAQEPVFPNGGHRQDAMWYFGDNNVRAWTYNGTKPIPEEKGILEVRDRLVQMVSESSKVAVVLSGDEHSYHRTLIDNQVPIGDITEDDKNDDDVIEPAEGFSSLSSLVNPVWYLSIGGAGAGYYSVADTPWNVYWRDQPDPRAGFLYSSQEHTSVFTVTDDGLAVEIYSIYGELIDRVDNLMAVK